MRSNAKKILKDLEKKFEKVKREAPRVLGVEGQNYFNEVFRKKSYEGQSWPEVQRRIPGTAAYRYPKNKYLSRRTNPILVGKTRRLSNAVNRSYNARKSNVSRLVWGIYGVKYAVYHNEGEGQKKRVFMGDGPTFRRKLKRKFESLYRGIGR